MKVAYIKNLSTTTIIDLYPFDLGNLMMKSIVALSHEHFGCVVALIAL